MLPLFTSAAVLYLSEHGVTKTSFCGEQWGQKSEQTPLGSDMPLKMHHPHLTKFIILYTCPQHIQCGSA